METELKKSDKHKRNLSDIEELVALAERVSANIQNLDETAYRFLIQAIISLAMSYAMLFAITYILLNNILNQLFWFILIFCALISIISLFLFMNWFRRRKLLRKQYESELSVMSKLLTMTHDLMVALNKDEIGIVTKVTLEMRLQRIKFAYNSKLKKVG